MRTLNERLNISVLVLEAPNHAVCLDTEQEINYLDTIFMYCDNNNLDAPSIEDEEFNAASNVLENFCKNAKNEGNDKVYFWIEAE